MSENYFNEADRTDRPEDRDLLSREDEDNGEDLFATLAEQILWDLSPKTVLVTLWGEGQLVAALRERGVDAYGVCFSEADLSRVREDIRPFCAAVLQGLPEKFDLIVSQELPEQLSAEEGRAHIAALCSRTDCILFSAAVEEPGRSNAQPRAYWARAFAEQNFYNDLSRRPSWLAPHECCFRRGMDWLTQLEHYESYIVKQAQREKEERWKERWHAEYRIDQLKTELERYEGVLTSKSWRITKPLRDSRILAAKLAARITAPTLVVKGIRSLHKYGWAVTWEKTRRLLQCRAKKPVRQYTQEELARQREKTFSQEVTFSILVPLYNTPEKFLREMLESVQAQTYPHWELCLADGSDDEHAHVGHICEEYIRQDSRIRYQKLEKNLGISGNTNACIDMSTGSYIGLFDHDDLLHPAALFEVMQVVCQEAADLIYTDETIFRHDPKDSFHYHYKPDYAPDTLRACNYICHFTVFSRELMEKVGKFRSEYDGSQDYDMILRLTENAQKIVHIPIALYHWRSHPNSVASDIGAKPYAIAAAKRAVGDHLLRLGLKGEVLDTPATSMYRLKYEVDGNPLISILIPNCDHRKDLELCLESIFSKSTYRNFEIIIIENNSQSREIFQYYRQIQARWRNVKVVTWEDAFNYSAINNFGARYASGEQLLLLNNDIEVISPDWLQEMLMYAQRPDIGAVGAKLYFPDDTIQHGGVVLGVGGVAGHCFRYVSRSSVGYMGRLVYAQNLSAVTAACMMLRREVWEQMGGLDESFEVAFNDVDLCMRIRKAGYLIAWTPFAELYHYESKSRGAENTPEKVRRFQGEVLRFQNRWKAELAAGDPYFNPNFRLDREDFTYL